MINWKLPHITVFVCFVFIVLKSTAAKQPAPPWIDMDYRVVFVDKLIETNTDRVFYDSKIKNFTAFIIDNKYGLIYVIGNKSHFLILDTSTLDRVKERTFGSKEIENTQRTCKTCKVDAYISFMQPMHSYHAIILCLSYVFNKESQYKSTADKPVCEVVKPQSLMNWMTTFEGSEFAPYNPLNENTILVVNESEVYVGAPFKYDDSFRIIRTQYPGGNGQIPRDRYLETPMRDDRYFYGRTDFVHSFHTKDAAFFLFRENSKEKMDCCQHDTRVTRLARICRNDPGGTGSEYPSSRNFITFLKASLICPTPGQFRFDEAQSAYWDERNKILYTVFSTADHAPSATAVCLYDFAAFNRVFEPEGKDEKNDKGRRPRCSSISNPHNIRKFRSDPQTKYPDTLLTKSVYPMKYHAVHIRYGERWTAMTVDHPDMPSTEKRKISIIFVATDRGSIMKISLITSKRSCSVEEYRFDENGERVDRMEILRITDRMLNKQTRHLLLTTNKRILKLPLHRCGRFDSRKACIEARDPYCGWDPQNEECTTYNTDVDEWQQDLSTCPDAAHPMNPRWSTWSTWSSCTTPSKRGRHQKNRMDTKQRCLCRYQNCIQPDVCAKETPHEPQIRFQVTDCKRKNKSAWGKWSAWSPCSQTCGQAIRRRNRTCNLGGKRNCHGAAQETKSCPIKICPDPVWGQWESWDSWSSCSNRCGGGHRQRTRKCLFHSLDRPCIGDSQEWANCTMHKCQEIQKSSQWTQWLRDDDEQVTGYVKKRFQFVCSADVANPKQVNTVKTITEVKTCKDKAHCDYDTASKTLVDQNGGWSEWSSWNTCSKTCDTGLQERSRACNNPVQSGNGKPCVGNYKEVQLCNRNPCERWGCWSDWTSCRSDCSQKRTRQCRDTRYGACASAPVEETRTCNTERCREDVYWTEWTRWSECSKAGTQYRIRKCTPGKSCYGSNKEFKSCYHTPHVPTDQSTNVQAGRYGLIHLILSDIICFIVGCAIAALVVTCIYRARYHRFRRAEMARARSHAYDLRQTLPPSGTSTIVRPNNLRIVNDIRSDVQTPRDGHSTAPLLPPRRYDMSSGSSTIPSPNHHYHSMNLSPASPPPLPPRLNSLPHRQHSLSANYALFKEAVL